MTVSAFLRGRVRRRALYDLCRSYFSTIRVKGDFGTLIPIQNASNHATIASNKDKDEIF